MGNFLLPAYAIVIVAISLILGSGRKDYFITNRSMGYSNSNIVLFQTISRYWDDVLTRGEAAWFIKYCGVHIIVFVPIGIGAYLVFRKIGRFVPIAVSAAYIVVVELLQYVTLTGFFDVDDIFLDLLGAVIGIVAGVFISKKSQTAL